MYLNFWRQPVLNPYELCVSKLLEVSTICVDGMLSIRRLFFFRISSLVFVYCVVTVIFYFSWVRLTVKNMLPDRKKKMWIKQWNREVEMCSFISVICDGVQVLVGARECACGLSVENDHPVRRRQIMRRRRRRKSRMTTTRYDEVWKWI